MRIIAPIGFLLGLFILVSFSSAPAWSLDLDWNGSFRSEYNFIHNYTMDSSDDSQRADAARSGAGGYYIPNAGSNDANFQTLFLRLQPKVIVNDNVSVKSEWWVGSPSHSFFGDSAPRSADGRYHNSTQSRGSSITAQRVWGEFITDFGTVQVGRAPLHWGLGLVYNSGDGVWDHFSSTGDTIRLMSKFGNFVFVPAFVSYSAGNAFGGACQVTGGAGTSTCSQTQGSGSVSEYTLGLKYENVDEDFEGGVNLVHRISGAGQDTAKGFTGPQGGVVGFNYNTWDLYVKKRVGKLTVAAEAPIVSGSIGAAEYSTFALASEVGFKANDTWTFKTKFGHAPGQPNASSAQIDNYKAFYFHPNYKLGNILFNYNFFNLAGPNTSNNPDLADGAAKSPYEVSIVNANYLMLGTELNADKWMFYFNWIYAVANHAADAGKNFFNTTTRTQSSAAAADTQAKSLGWELDLGSQFKWDDHFTFGLDLGLFKPGDYFKFSNLASKQNQTDLVFALGAKVGVVF